MENPTIVREAFVPTTAHCLDVESILILESLGCRYLTGGQPGLKDAVLCWLALTDLDSLKKARATGTADQLVEDWGRGKSPAELLALQPQIAAAIEAAFAPVASTGADGPDGEDPLATLQKKDLESAGGSPSSTPSPGNTTGRSATS